MASTGRKKTGNTEILPNPGITRNQTPRVFHPSILHFRLAHQLAQQAAGHEQTRAVRRGVVLESDLAAVPGELLGGGLAHAHVALDGGVDHLRQHVLVGEAHHEPVLGRVVLVLVLADQPLAGAVVGLALAPAAELDLVALEVRLRLLDLDERLVLVLLGVSEAVRGLPGGRGGGEGRAAAGGTKAVVGRWGRWRSKGRRRR